MKVAFSWDSSKSNINYEKHGVSFEEARSVFLDQNAIEFFDEDHSEREERFLMLGMSYKSRILLISYTDNKISSSTIICIISARKATKKEQLNY
jgi:uncharacterized protein